MKILLAVVAVVILVLSALCFAISGDVIGIKVLFSSDWYFPLAAGIGMLVSVAIFAALGSLRSCETRIQRLEDEVERLRRVLAALPVTGQRPDPPNPAETGAAAKRGNSEQGATAIFPAAHPSST
jgi:hypothetical protein